MNQDAKFGEAVAALTARLRNWGASEPEEHAAEFMRDLLHQGWRPVAPETLRQPVRCQPIDPKPWAEQARQALRASRVGGDY